MKFLAVILATLTAASAHEVRPAFLELKERAPGEFDVLWKVPALGGTPLASEEIAHPQPAVADEGPTHTVPCGCPAPSAAELSRGVLATLGHVSLPTAPVEAVIALSIVFVATEIIRSKRGQTGLTERSPWLVAFVFGLLHGFGVAGALGELGLPPNDIPLALLLFNIGVEAGQLAFVAVVFAVIALVRRARFPFPRWTPFIPPYAIGGGAMFWVIQRIATL